MLIFRSVCLEVYKLRLREVRQCVCTVSNSTLFGEKRIMFISSECKEMNLLCWWVRGFNLPALPS